MNKPVKDWTLGEVKAYCKKHGTCGKECRFFVDVHERCALIRKDPELWDLNNAPALTPDELAVCRLFKSGDIVIIKRCERDLEFTRKNGYKMAYSEDLCLFPSLRPGDELDLTTMKLD